MSSAAPSLHQELSRLLEEGPARPEDLARALVPRFGDRALAALWRTFVRQELDPPVAAKRWREAEALRERLEDAHGKAGGESSVPLLAALLILAARGDASIGAGRYLPEEEFAQLEHSSSTDALTGLYNRRYFRDAFHRELKRSKRYRHPLSVLMLDLDDFKSYNDANGHLAGDEALQETARLLLANCREIDTVCRYGGEEFVALLPATDKEGARVLGEKLRRRIEEHPFEGEASCPSGQLTVSGGISTFPEDGLTEEELLANADQSLYQAKNFIKNAVCYYFREDRRAYPRIEKEYVLRVRPAGDEADADEEWTRSRTRDISRGGLSFVQGGPEVPRLGDAMELEIETGRRPLRLTGRVVRVERYEAQGPYTVGISFDPPPEEVAELLARL